MKGHWFLTLAQGRAPCTTLILGQISQNWHSCTVGPAGNWDSLTCESGRAGKVRKEAFVAQGNNGEMKWKLGTLCTSVFHPQRALGSSSQNPALL